MKPFNMLHLRKATIGRQRGVVLFFALIALLAMSLAAVALIRSVDTSTIIAGNLALKQSATTSSDAGVEAASIYLAGMQAANSGLSATDIATHAFNTDDPSKGYYASVNLAVDPIGMVWDNTNSAAVNPDGSNNPQPDASGNSTRYVIHRMCRDSGVALKNTTCLFATPPTTNMDQSVHGYGDYCPECESTTTTPQMRITTRTTGPRNTISFVQAFAY